MIDVDRFLSHTLPEPNTGCLLWTASYRPNGYGQFAVNRRATYAHRVAFTIANGAIPDGLSVLHRCDTPSCVNADHLFLGTQADNVRDAAAKGRLRNAHSGKTHCHHGHAFTTENTKFTNGGARKCRTCERTYRRAWARAKAARS